MKSIYEQTPDEQLVHYARLGDNDALEYLLEKYKNLVRSKVRSYFLIGADRDDIMQEGMIGLYKAIRDFKPDKQSGFRAFAELCVTRQIITAIKTATRQKHIPLNSYVSLNKPIYDEESDRTLMDVISGAKVTNPEDMKMCIRDRHIQMCWFVNVEMNINLQDRTKDIRTFTLRKKGLILE